MKSHHKQTVEFISVILQSCSQDHKLQGQGRGQDVSVPGQDQKAKASDVKAKGKIFILIINIICYNAIAWSLSQF